MLIHSSFDSLVVIMDGAELRRRVNQLGLTYVMAAKLLGLSSGGLHKMNGRTRVSRQTELLLKVVEGTYGLVPSRPRHP